jgi:hypothetical protein
METTPPPPHFDDAGYALMFVCPERTFFNWIDRAGEDRNAIRLRIRWPQVLLSWRRRCATHKEVLEIIVSDP